MKALTELNKNVGISIKNKHKATIASFRLDFKLVRTLKMKGAINIKAIKDIRSETVEGKTVDIPETIDNKNIVDKKGHL